MMGLAHAAARTRRPSPAKAVLDVTRYGGVLKRAATGRRARRGPAFDGLYYVKSVTHKIKRGEYKQNFTLTRNGLVSTVQTVNPVSARSGAAAAPAALLRQVSRAW
jgi:hypothetical protein